MKKCVLLLLIASQITFAIAQQKDSTILNEEEYIKPIPIELNSKNKKDYYIQQKGNVFIQGYLGFSILATTNLSVFLGGSGKVTKYNISGILPDFMLGEYTGIAFELSYSYYEINPNTIKRVLRPQVRLNFHLTKSKIWDTYIFFNLGTRLVNETPRNIFLPSQSHGISIFGQTYYRALIPLSAKTGFGFRYFPFKHFGFYTEIAAGTPFFLGGISYKLK